MIEKLRNMEDQSGGSSMKSNWSSRRRESRNWRRGSQQIYNSKKFPLNRRKTYIHILKELTQWQTQRMKVNLYLETSA